MFSRSYGVDLPAGARVAAGIPPCRSQERSSPPRRPSSTACRRKAHPHAFARRGPRGARGRPKVCLGDVRTREQAHCHPRLSSSERQGHTARGGLHPWRRLGAGRPWSLAREPISGGGREKLLVLCHKLRRERPFVFAPQHGQRDRMATSFAMNRRRKVEIELGT
jgi:hypothetical protein